jgi:short-subunit dehydrogenase
MNKCVLITGDTSGLGKQLSIKFQSEGYSVMNHGGKSQYDLSKHRDVERLALDAKENNVKILINNAAIVCPSLKLGQYKPNNIINMINVNLAAPILLSYYLLDSLESIVNINSMVGLEIKSPRTLYSATKWGLRGFANSLKAENKNINILDVYPTNIKTTPDRKNAMDIQMVVDNIYNSYLNKEEQLILDGRKK